MHIEDDNGLSELVISDSDVTLCGGFRFTEGPIWVPDGDYLLFSDIPNNRIHRWVPGSTYAEVFREPSHHSNGLTLDHAGMLIACEHSARRVTRAALPDGEIEIIAEFVDGTRFNSPNDVVVHTSGSIYFTDPTYGLNDAGASQDLDVQGVYRLDSDGVLTLLVSDFAEPNGLAFSPDERILYIGDSAKATVRRFDVDAAGNLSGGDIFVDMRPDRRPGGPDGMKVDRDGRLWTTGKGGVWVIEPDGTWLGVLAVPEIPANIAFGGADFTSIFLTAHTSVYRVETRVTGLAPGSPK